MSAVDYSKTLNLPQTDFSMKASLPTKEPARIEAWTKEKLYETMVENAEGKQKFIFHDGPPYANGDMHIGHALNKLLKDFILKYKTMSGYQVAYIPGWDTHGLPIELQMLKKHKVNRKEMDPLAFRALCEQFARENVDRQKEQIRRLGVICDFDNPYLTLQHDFEAKQIEIFGKMAQKGYIYQGKKPVYWCPHDETALAEAEIEYSDDPCTSIYVKFNVTDDRGVLAGVENLPETTAFVIWTTTPWTLPANTAICLGPDFKYQLVRYGNVAYFLAEDLVESFEKAAGLSDGTVLAEFVGRDLEYMKAAHPFLDRESLVIIGDHVTLESGTGCVHTAPGHGHDDYLVCMNYKELKEDYPVPVDSKGRMTEEAGKYCGLKTDEANVAILADMEESGALLAKEEIVHQYPHCWRCKHPILFRATKQWFCSVEDFKQEAIDAVHNVTWIPEWGEARIESMVADRADWCISRQRIWGVPIPIFYCKECGKVLLNEETIAKIADWFNREGSDAWYSHTVEELVGHHTCECGASDWEKGDDIMDVWFDSGSSYAAVLERAGQTFPADLYLEGNDQYRGWFQSSLLTSVATRGTAPYKSVITHGMVVDGEGKKMSKSLGNGVDPMDVAKQYGADILRLWVSSSDYTGDVRISPEILKQLSEIYRKIRNTLRILMANLRDTSDFDPTRDLLPVSETEPLDRWAMSRFEKLVGRVREAYDSYAFHLIYHDVHNFCTIDLSKQYVDITKDRLYVEQKDAKTRRAVQSTMYRILHGLTRLIAPLLSFTAEEAWESFAHLEGDRTESVFLNPLPEMNGANIDEDALATYNHLFEYRDDVMKALEIARADKKIGKSLEAKVIVYGAEDNHAMQIFSGFSKKELADLFIVSGAELSNDAAPSDAFTETESKIAVSVVPADGEKCCRCWMYTTDTTTDEDGNVLCARCRKVLGL